MKLFALCVVAGVSGLLAVQAGQVRACEGGYDLRTKRVDITYESSDEPISQEASQLCANPIAGQGEDYILFMDRRTGGRYQILREFVALPDKTSAITGFLAGAKVFTYHDGDMKPAPGLPAVSAASGLEVVSSFTDDKRVPWKLYVYGKKLYAVETARVVLTPVCPPVRVASAPQDYSHAKTTGSAGKNAGAGCIALQQLAANNVLDEDK